MVKSSAKLPPSNRLLPVHLSESLRRPRAPPPGPTSRSPRQIATLAFAHRPERLDLTRPALLQATSAPDRVSLHYHAADAGAAGGGGGGGGVRLVGARSRPTEGSSAREYVLIYESGAWYLEPVSDVVTGIKPVVGNGGGGSGTAPAPVFPERAGVDNGGDRDVWSAGGTNGLRSRPVSPSGGGGGAAADATAKPGVTGATAKGAGNGRATCGGSGGGGVKRRPAGKGVPGVRRGDEDMEMDAALDAAMGSDDTGGGGGGGGGRGGGGRGGGGRGGGGRGGGTGAKTVAGKSVSGEGQNAVGGRAHRDGDSSGSESGSESGSGNSSGSDSGSGSSGSDDSVEYTDGSSDDGGG
jgi:hypothetical protein